MNRPDSPPFLYRPDVRGGLNPEQGRIRNLQTLLDAVRQHPGSTRPELAELVALTVQSTHGLTEELLGQGLLLRGDKRRGGRGQPAVELHLNPDGAFSIGLHLDRDHVTGILSDLTGRVRAREHHELRYPQPQATFDLIAQMVTRLRAAVSQQRRIWGIGAAFPGPLDLRTGVISQPPNFPGWDGVNARRELEERCGLPVTVQHDGAAAALGERWYGAGQAYQNFFYVFSGIGLGGGVVVGGRVFAGAHGNINFGHVPVVPGGRPCPCGSQGCVEQYASIGVLHDLLAQDYGLDAADPERLAHLHAAGHPGVRRWIEQAADHLTPALLAAINLLGPEAVVFGGRLPPALQEDLLAQLRPRLAALHTRGMPMTTLLMGTVTNDAASMGAATLPIYHGLHAHHFPGLEGAAPTPLEGGAAMSP